jgi:anaerobic selenocysteine-containing dehydrogenase
MSLTAASADEWLPLRPGSEPAFALAVARLLLDANLARKPEQVPASVLESIRGADLAALISRCGIEATQMHRVARELGESEAPLIVGGASIVQTNSVRAVEATHYLNVLLGNIGKPGGVLPPSPEFSAVPETASVAAIKSALVLFLDRQNPAYTFPSAAGIAKALSNIEMVVSFGGFIDDSAAYADWILPDHHPLESAAAVVPAVSPRPAITVAVPFVQPLYDTRPIEQTLGDIARKVNLGPESVTPRAFAEPLLPGDQTWNDVVRQGGLWMDNPEHPPAAKAAALKLEASDAIFSGDAQRFPLLFQPYLSLQYHDGSGSNLPWMQELPDPVSSAMWDLPVEIDPQSAARLNLTTGDWVRVESAAGSLEAPAYVHPAALPNVISMAIGEGHTRYGRYASGRGANPLSILAPAWENETGSLAFGATRVQVVRLERKQRELVQFSPQDREQGPWGHR